MIASTFTGTVSFVSACLGAESGGLNTLVDDGHDVVDDRNDEEKPGPLTPRNLPARRITNFCQVFAIFSAEATTIAKTTDGEYLGPR